MATMVYHESYGQITKALLAAIRKNNVSPSDYDMLCDDFGQENHDVILAKIKEWSPDGNYNMPMSAWWR